jgi:hypothetical protein
MGVLADGKTALFLVSSDAVATGDGKCLPTPQNCERVEMRAGQTEFFDVTTPEGETVQYQLDVQRVSRRTTADSAMAAAARSRESTQGRQVLRSAVSTGQVEVSDLAYSRELGLVVPSGARTQQPGSLFGGFRVDLRFGAAGQLVKRYNLARLTPLPSVDVPSFVYLGVLSDGESALFLNPTEAAASGDAVCLPSPEECQRIQLKAGQTGTLSAPTLNGQAEEYEIAVDGISKVEAATAEEAPREHQARVARRSPRPAPAHHRGRLAGQRSELLGRLGRARADRDAGPLAAPHTLQRLMALRMITAGESHGPGSRRSSRACPRARPRSRGDRPRHGPATAGPWPWAAHEDREDSARGHQRRRATGARWAGPIACGSPTATTPNCESG